MSCSENNIANSILERVGCTPQIIVIHNLTMLIHLGIISRFANTLFLLLILNTILWPNNKTCFVRFLLNYNM